DCGIAGVGAVESIHGVSIARHPGATQADAGKQSLRPRISQHLGGSFPVSVGRSITSDRSSSRRSLATDLELIGHEMVHALFVHDQHHQVHAFHADLQAPASAGDGEECGRAPASSGAAGGHAASMLAAEYKASLYQ